MPMRIERFPLTRKINRVELAAPSGFQESGKPGIESVATLAADFRRVREYSTFLLLSLSLPSPPLSLVFPSLDFLSRRQSSSCRACVLNFSSREIYVRFRILDNMIVEVDERMSGCGVDTRIPVCRFFFFEVHFVMRHKSYFFSQSLSSHKHISQNCIQLLCRISKFRDISSEYENQQNMFCNMFYFKVSRVQFLNMHWKIIFIVISFVAEIL